MSYRSSLGALEMARSKKFNLLSVYISVVNLIFGIENLRILMLSDGVLTECNKLQFTLFIFS